MVSAKSPNGRSGISKSGRWLSHGSLISQATLASQMDQATLAYIGRQESGTRREDEALPTRCSLETIITFTTVGDQQKEVAGRQTRSAIREKHGNGGKNFSALSRQMIRPCFSIPC